MKLATKEVTIGDETYVVREVTIGEMQPLLPKLEIPEEAQETQMQIMRMCISDSQGEMGERVSDLGIASYMKLVGEVMIINGLKDEGKD